MRLIHVQKRNGLDRKGFTLIELLVVITIIGILMALTLGVISRIYGVLDETKVVAEVNRLSVGCNQFKATFGRYPAARIMLCENPATYNSFAAGSAQQILASYSSEYISSVFPGLLNSASSTTNGIDWSGFGVSTGSPKTFVLEGEEALVFFLGGIRPNGGAPTGFNTDKTQLAVVSTGARLGPFFEFDESRVKPSTFNAASLSRFPIYQDVYGTAYAYFVARIPGMNNYFHPVAAQLVTNPITGVAFTPAERQFLSDCYGLTGNYAPLWQQFVTGTGVKYFKSDTFQIVSAGKDKLFGCGGQWNQTDPEQSTFAYMNFPANVYDPTTTATDKQSTYDNITNVTNGRVVPK